MCLVGAAAGRIWDFAVEKLQPLEVSGLGFVRVSGVGFVRVYGFLVCEGLGFLVCQIFFYAAPDIKLQSKLDLINAIAVPHLTRWPYLQYVVPKQDTVNHKSPSPKPLALSLLRRSLATLNLKLLMKIFRNPLSKPL